MSRSHTPWIVLFLPLLLVACAETMEAPTAETATVAEPLLVEPSASLDAPTVTVGADPDRIVATSVAAAELRPVADGLSVTPVDAATPEAPVRLVDVVSQETELEFGAVGMMVTQVDGAIVIDEVMDGMAAAEAGLEPGWEVLAVDGIETEGMGLHQFVEFVRGEAGTSVTLTVVGDGTEAHEVDLVREVLVVSETRCDRLRRTRSQTEFGAVGVRLGGACNGVYVRSVEAGMPAEAAGLAVGDVITSVDGMRLTGAHLMDVVGAIRGEAGTTVELGVRSAEGGVRTVELERVHMVVPQGGSCGE